MHIKSRLTRRVRPHLLAAAAAALTLPLLLGATPATPAAASVAAGPTITGPLTGGNGKVVLQATAFGLDTVGYTQSEFLQSGTATSYAPAAPLDSDGQWQVTPASTGPYTSRIVVNRPTDPARFNGTVVVEWLNVSGGLDAAPEWIYAHNELIREGYAWVGVSAQATGAAATEAADPVRYAELSHPGDSYSYDIFSQAGQAVRDSAATVLDGLRPRTVLAERRVPVRVPPHHLHQRGPAPGVHVRRFPRAQPARTSVRRCRRHPRRTCRLRRWSASARTWTRRCSSCRPRPT